MKGPLMRPFFKPLILHSTSRKATNRTTRSRSRRIDHYMDIKNLIDQLEIPVIQAPMFGVSGPDMVIAACWAGVIGSLPAPNARTAEVLGYWYAQINAATKGLNVPWAANVIVHSAHARAEADLEQVYKHQPPIVITALGSPCNVVDGIHDYGGFVLADVADMHQAEKSLEAGVDGLVLICSGAGGYTGTLSAFAFVEEVRRIFDGLIVVAGAINTGRSIRAALAMGADLAYVGTGFIATRESTASRGHKDMVINSSIKDIVVSDKVTGTRASLLEPSIQSAGFDPYEDNPPVELNLRELSDLDAWKDLWAAGQGVGATTANGSIADVVNRLKQQYISVS